MLLRLPCEVNNAVAVFQNVLWVFVRIQRALFGQGSKVAGRFTAPVKLPPKTRVWSQTRQLSAPFFPCKDGAGQTVKIPAGSRRLKNRASAGGRDRVRPIRRLPLMTSLMHHAGIDPLFVPLAVPDEPLLDSCPITDRCAASDCSTCDDAAWHLKSFDPLHDSTPAGGRADDQHSYASRASSCIAAANELDHTVPVTWLPPPHSTCSGPVLGLVSQAPPPQIAANGARRLTAAGGSRPPRRPKRPSIEPTSEDQVEQKRRRNRESSARCYYNRKMRLEREAFELGVLKRRAIDLYGRANLLRNENERLARELNLAGVAIPSRTDSRRHIVLRPDARRLN